MNSYSSAVTPEQAKDLESLWLQLVINTPDVLAALIVSYDGELIATFEMPEMVEPKVIADQAIQLFANSDGLTRRREMISSSIAAGKLDFADFGSGLLVTLHKNDLSFAPEDE